MSLYRYREARRKETPHHYVFILTFTIYIVVISFRHYSSFFKVVELVTRSLVALF